MKFLATLQGRARGAAHEQAALGADDARHHHRRRRGHRDGRRRRRRAGARRGPDQEPRLEPDHRAARQRHGRRRAHGRGLAADALRGRRVRAAARDPVDRGVGAAASRQRARSCSATATGRRRSSASRRTTSSRATGSSRPGAAIEQADVDAARRSSLLGQTVARNLFGEADPVGETIRIRRVPHAIVGVLERKGQSMVGPGPGRRRADPDLDRAQARARRPAGEVAQRAVDHRQGAATAQTSRDAEQEMRDLLRQRHRLQAEPGGRLLPPQPGRGARRAGSELAACSRCCSRRSRRCRCSSAASAS